MRERGKELKEGSTMEVLNSSLRELAFQNEGAL